MASEHGDGIQPKFIELSELQLTFQFIIPLFRRLGYDDVEYTGGPTEYGKDIIAWKKDEIGDTHLTVVQVKKFKLSGSAADPTGFPGVVTQLQQCLEKPVAAKNGVMHLPAQVYFVTPYTLRQSALASRVEAYANLRRVKVIDGTRLANLVSERAPELLAQLVGPTDSVHSAARSHVSNRPLLSALRYAEHKAIRSIYVDIDLALGKATTRLFLSAAFEPQAVTCQSTSDSEWQACLDTASSLGALGWPFMIERPDDVVARRAREVVAYDDWSREMASAKKIERRLQDQLTKLEAELHEFSRKEDESYPGLRTARREGDGIHAMREELEAIRRKRTLSVAEARKWTTVLAAGKANDKLVANLSRQSKFKKDVRRLQTAVENCRSEIEECRANLESLSGKHPPEPAYRFSVDGQTICARLTEKRSRVLAQIEGLNSAHPTPQRLAVVLSECHAIFEAAHVLLSHDTVRRAAGMASRVTYVSDTAASRLNVGIEDIIDAGLNLSIFGAPGAGKTTSLQVYALKKMESRDDRLVMFLPLVRLARCWKRGIARDQLPENAAENLEQGIVFLLNHEGASVSMDWCCDVFAKGSAVVLFDGIDEAVSEMPWIVQAIASFAQRRPKVQVVLSSRMSGAYIDRMPFLGMTLLPMSDEQRQKFFQNWFGEKRDLANAICAHLRRNRKVGEIARSPLSATILCVLCENGIALPRTPIRMYEERMRLLLGSYDLFKQVERVKSPPDHLEMMARRLAFWMHKRRCRDIAREAIGAAIDEIRGSLSAKEALLALEELVDPCNVLVPMSENGDVGFDHLSYQEYLAAKEIGANRSIDIVAWLGDAWWRNVMIFYAQIADSLEWLVDVLVERGVAGPYRARLEEMIEVSSDPARNRARSVVRRHAKLDTLQEALDDEE